MGRKDRYVIMMEIVKILRLKKFIRIWVRKIKIPDGVIYAENTLNKNKKNSKEN